MDQPQPCTKCKKLPEDILMLACSHDLCLDCASERLAFEMKKKKGANVAPQSLRASSVKSATSAQPSTPKASQNWKDSSPPTRLQSPNRMPSPGRPSTDRKEWSRSRKCRPSSEPKTGHTSGSQCGSTPRMLPLPARTPPS
jgi:hypothetical protein